jgi:hypothetical protein
LVVLLVGEDLIQIYYHHAPHHLDLKRAVMMSISHDESYVLGLIFYLIHDYV